MCLSFLDVFRSCCCDIVSIYLCVCVSEQACLVCICVSALMCWWLRFCLSMFLWALVSVCAFPPPLFCVRVWVCKRVCLSPPCTGSRSPADRQQASVVWGGLLWNTNEGSCWAPGVREQVNHLAHRLGAPNQISLKNSGAGSTGRAAVRAKSAQALMNQMNSAKTPK